MSSYGCRSKVYRGDARSYERKRGQTLAPQEMDTFSENSFDHWRDSTQVSRNMHFDINPLTENTNSELGSITLEHHDFVGRFTHHSFNLRTA
jgi:hypothetical protein